MHSFWWVLFGAVGLALGSFGNVLIHRIHAEEAILGRSMCATCKRALRWFELFPLLSYVWLRGRCLRCRKTISMQYPLVEAGSMGTFVFALSLSPHDPLGALLTGLVLYFLLLACVYDFRHEHIPDAFTMLLFIVAAADVIVYGGLVPSIIGGLIPIAWFGVQWALSRGKAVGSGDIYLGGAIGFWLGTWHAVQFIVLSYVAGTVVLLALLLMRKYPRGQRVAFVPFMGMGVVLTLLRVGDAYLAMVM